MEIRAAEFEFIRELLLRRSGIVLEHGKEYLIEARLAPLARREGLDTLGELVARLREDRWTDLHGKVVDAMTTNETSFFRDQFPFEALKNQVIPELISRRSGESEVRIWSAACSSGQEPYSIAMLLHDHFPALTAQRLMILATDLSAEMVARARSGCFSPAEVRRGLPAPLLARYFQRDGQEWRIREELRRLVEFRELNLAEAWPPLPWMDCIFLRNVLIYLGLETKRAILRRAARQLRPGGYLFLGAAETTLSLDDSFERVQMGHTPCYRRRG